MRPAGVRLSGTGAPAAAAAGGGLRATAATAATATVAAAAAGSGARHAVRCDVRCALIAARLRWEMKDDDDEDNEIHSRPGVRGGHRPEGRGGNVISPRCDILGDDGRALRVVSAITARRDCVPCAGVRVNQGVCVSVDSCTRVRCGARHITTTAHDECTARGIRAHPCARMRHGAGAPGRDRRGPMAALTHSAAGHQARRPRAPCAVGKGVDLTDCDWWL